MPIPPKNFSERQKKRVKDGVLVMWRGHIAYLYQRVIYMWRCALPKPTCHPLSWTLLPFHTLPNIIFRAFTNPVLGVTASLSLTPQGALNPCQIIVPAGGVINILLGVSPLGSSNRMRIWLKPIWVHYWVGSTPPPVIKQNSGTRT